MKINFKKITAIATSVLMVGMTMGVAAAASFPSPYSSSTSAGVAIVSGTGAGVDDTVAVNSISSYLANKVLASGGAVVEGGDAFQLEKDKDKFNLGDSFTSFYSTLDDGELEDILIDGIFSNDANDDFDYTQKITLGSLTLTHFLETSDDDFSSKDVPIIGFELTDDDFILNYTLEFTPDDAEAGGVWSSGNDLETTEITMLGRTYYVLSARNTTSDDHKITLLDTANSNTITQGETVTMTSNGVSYDVSINWMSSSEVILDVNDITTNKLSEGGVYKIAPDVYIAVKNNLFTDAQTPLLNKVQISLGSGKIEIENGEEVKINNEDISETTDSVLTGYVNANTAGTKLDKIVLKWDLDEDAWIIPGEELVFPGFETIKLSMGGFIIPGEEISTIENKGDDAIQIDTVIKDGDITLEILYLNDSKTGYAGLGYASDHILVTNDSSSNSIRIQLNETENSYFAATWVSGDDSESYVFEIDSISDSSGKNATTLKNLATGGEDIIIDEVGEEEDAGEVRITLTAASDDEKTATVTLTRARTTGTLYADRIVTSEGMQFRLPVHSELVTTDGYINLTAPHPTTWVMNFTEEDTNNQIEDGLSFTVTLGISATDGTGEGEPATLTGITDHELTDGSDTDIGYMVSDLATKTLFTKPSSGTNDLVITYHGGEAYGEVFVTEYAVTLGSSEVGSMVFTDAEKTSWQSRDVILVGGSCINSATATALGVASGTCEAAFTAATGVGSGQYLIQSVGDAFTSGKIALVVAGYETADTAAAASRLVNQPSTIDTTAGNKYLGVVGVEGTSTVSKVA